MLVSLILEGRCQEELGSSGQVQVAGVGAHSREGGALVCSKGLTPCWLWFLWAGGRGQGVALQREAPAADVHGFVEASSPNTHALLVSAFTSASSTLVLSSVPSKCMRLPGEPPALPRACLDPHSQHLFCKPMAATPSSLPLGCIPWRRAYPCAKRKELANSRVCVWGVGDQAERKVDKMLRALLCPLGMNLVGLARLQVSL